MHCSATMAPLEASRGENERLLAWSGVSRERSACVPAAAVCVKSSLWDAKSVNAFELKRSSLAALIRQACKLQPAVINKS